MMRSKSAYAKYLHEAREKGQIDMTDREARLTLQRLSKTAIPVHAQQAYCKKSSKQVQD